MPQLRSLLAAAMESRVDQVAIHPSDKLDRDFLGADGLALAMIRAASEEFLGHRRDHVRCSLVALRLPLRKRIEMRDFRGGEQHGRRVGAGCHARPATDAGRCVHRPVGGFLWYKDGARIRRDACGRADETAGVPAARGPRAVRN